MAMSLLRGMKIFRVAGLFGLLLCMSVKPVAAQSVALDWAKGFGGPGSTNLWGASIATDAVGNVYTVGNLSLTADFDPGTGTANLTSAGGADLFISKLDASGNFVWAFRIGGTGGETGEGMVADASGNLYITGSFSNTVDFDAGAGTTNLTSSGSTDIYILKLNSSGVFQWAKKIGGAGNDYGNSITLDPSGNVLLTGLFDNTVDFDPGAGTTNLVSKGLGDIFVTKFDASGSFVWAKSVGGATGTDVGNDIKTDAAGNVYTTGSFGGIVDFDPGLGVNNLTANVVGCTFVLKLNADGTFGWAKHFSGVLYNEGNAIAIDNNNNVIVAGLFDGVVDFDPGSGIFNQTEAGSDDFFICKLDASGSFVWAHGFGSIQEDDASGIDVDDAGNCYATGNFASTVDFDPGSSVSNLSSSPSNAYDIYILKLDASGNFVWVGQMGGVNDLESGNAITHDAGGNIYTTGNFYGTADFDPNAGTSNLTGTGTGRNVFIQKLKPLAPSITSFSPTTGPVGTAVTIIGTNFSTTPSDNTVYFGAVRATVTTATSTQLTVDVPLGTTYQNISVTVNGLTAYSNAPFIVTFDDGGVIDACSFSTPVGTGPVGKADEIALGDLDGDGKTDVVITEYGGDLIRVFRNITTAGTINAASFETPVDIAMTTGSDPLAVSIADIDGDGKLDIIASGWAGSIISILRNSSTIGALSFDTRVDLTTGAAPYHIRCQDLDGDGKTDIAVGNAGSGSISIWQNIGSPGSITASSFNSRIDVAAPSSGFAIADVDLDGKPDLIGGYNGGTSVGICRNISTGGTLTTGSFATAVNFTVGAWPEQLVVGDLDADDKPDIVTSSWPGNTISILKNTSTPGSISSGSFAATVDIGGNGEPRGVVITDFDGDGLPDIGLSNQTSNVSIYKNANTPGSITTASFPSRKDFPGTGNARGIMSGDIDGDGKPDLVVGTWDGSLTFLRNTVSSLPAPTGSSFNPTSGPVGTSVTITGTNFSTTSLNNTVKFNGVTASVTASTSTSITAIVPSGATTGSISVQVGCNTIITVSPFTITNAPAITSFSPAQGEVGATVTITGTNFSATPANNTVKFNGTAATVTASSSTSITTTVPIGATSGVVTVTTASGTGTSSSSFTVIVFSITQQPVNPNNRCEGSSITFSTDATGTTNIAYQWQKLNTTTSLFEDISDGGAYSGTNTKNLLISNIQITEAGDYRCKITGDFVSTVYCNTAVLTVNTTPTIPTVTNASRCGTGSVILNASGTTDGNYIWYGSNGMSEPLAGENNSAYTTPSLTSTTDYYVSIVNAFCESSLVQVTATINSVPGAPSTSNVSRCGSGLATLTASGGTNGDYRWYTTPSGGIAIAGETNNTYTTPSLTGNTTFYVALRNNNCESSRTAMTVTVNPVPSAPAITASSRCGNGAVTLVAAGASNGQYRWYTQTTGGSAITGEVNSTYTTPTLSNTTTYYVSIDNGTCESARTSVTATINSLPSAPSTTGASRCGNGTVSLSAAGGSSGQYRWYTQLTGGASIIGEVNDTYTTPALNTTTTYYVSIDNGTCESTRSSVTATINSIPSAATTTGASRCGNGAVTLSAAGGSNGQYRWYTQSTGGAAITSEVNSTYTTLTLTNNTDYYVSIDNGLCEGSRTLVTATVNAIPASPTVTSISRCGSGTVTLKASGGANGQYRWYTQSTGGTPVAGEVNDSFTTPSLASTTTFYTSLTSSACESSRTPVDAVVFPLPAKPVIDPSGSLVICSGKTRVVTSSSAASYSWSNGANSQQITIASAGSYTVIITDNNGCVSVASDPVTITVQDCTNNRPPTIQSETATTQVGGTVTFDVLHLLSDPDDNLDLSTLRIVTQPISGAHAILANGTLLIDYKGVSFSGTDRIRIEVCDIASSCAQQDILVEVTGDITVYNAVSPNGDGKNEVFVIQYIDLLPQTVKNKVTIYNRWGDEVFSITDYDNVERAFAGDGNDGRKLPTGTYFYKIVFAGGHASQSGFLQLNY
jgi:gliding motility-associated-like protein